MIGLLMLMGISLALLVVLLTAMLAWEMVHPPRHTLAWAMARKLPCDPGELGLPFEEWQLDRLDGARIAVWEVDCRGRRSNTGDQSEGEAACGLTAVFVHGWGHSRIDSLQRIGPFVSLVDRIVLYDLRGHGETPGASRLGDGEDDDLLALLERLDDGESRFLLVGHSMGAVIALRAATKATLVPPSLEGRGGTHRLIAGVIAYAPYIDFHRSLRGRLRVHGYPARPISDLALLVHRVRGVKPASIDLKRVAALDAPLLVIHGVEDAVAPVDDSRRIVEHAREATLVEIHDAAHADAHRVDEARHDDAVSAFVMRACAEGRDTRESLK